MRKKLDEFEKENAQLEEFLARQDKEPLLSGRLMLEV